MDRLLSFLPHPVRRALPLIVAIICGIALLKGLYDLWEMLMFSLRGPMNADAFIYLTVGRGILNGLKPYTDLFESKPPGIYFLMALSQLFTGGERLATIIETLFLGLTPALFGLWMWRKTVHEKTDRVRQMMLISLSILLGILLSLRLQQIVGGLQTELFGVFFALTYVLALVWNDAPMGKVRIGIASFSLMCAIGLKEPFFLACLAAALLICNSPRAFVRSFIVPLIIAAAADGLILLLTGYWGGYWNFYLPAMLKSRIAGANDFPLWVKALWIRRLFASHTDYSPMPLLGWVLAGSLALVLVRRIRFGILNRLLAIASIVILAYGCNHIVQLWRIRYEMHAAGLFDTSLVPQYGEYMAYAWACGIAFAAVLGISAWRSIGNAMEICRVIVVLLLMTLIFGIGGYTGNDAAFAFAGYFAIAFLALRELHEWNSDARWGWPAIGALTLLGVLLFRPLPLKDREAFLAAKVEYKASSAWIDELIESCGSVPYALDGDYPASAFAVHSPLGPIFTPYFHDYLGYDHPLYRQTFQAIKERAQIIIVRAFHHTGPDPIPADILSLFGPYFPPCSVGISPPEGFTVLYRSADKGGTLFN